MGWWWAGARSPVGHEITLGSYAVLSDGRVAFRSTTPNPGGRGAINVTNLLTGTTRTAAVLSGTVGADDLALSGNELAWAQQSTVPQVVARPAPGGGILYECTQVPLSPPELAILDLRDTTSQPVLVTGVPIPPQYADSQDCIQS